MDWDLATRSPNPLCGTAGRTTLVSRQCSPTALLVDPASFSVSTCFATSLRFEVFGGICRRDRRR